ncbi:hypothetical protein D5086_017745 [Populus alba]|uniref:Uncharacterized protein n=1 Tax=Populus alba TaxID=43335 RepID=A0ACC4BNF7_POPAL
MAMEMEFHGGGRPQGNPITFTIVKRNFPMRAQCHLGGVDLPSCRLTSRSTITLITRVSTWRVLVGWSTKKTVSHGFEWLFPSCQRDGGYGRILAIFIGDGERAN